MSSAPYKFVSQLNQLQVAGVHCPPLGACPQVLVAWRWVANPLTAQCFEPPAVRNPLRQLNDPVKICSSWALSMHITESQSIDAFKSLEKNFKKARKVFGDHVAQVRISLTDGVCTSPDYHGHFDLHLYANSAAHSNVIAMSIIP